MLGIYHPFLWSNKASYVDNLTIYKVKKLDRVLYAGLTKKDLPRGKWRHIKNIEVVQLKHFLQTGVSK